MNAKHTPGPWFVASAGRYKVATIATAGIYADEMPGDDVIPDARLIAAAPLLLDALQGLMAIVNETKGVDGYHLNGAVAEWDEFPEISGAAAAIAAATN